MRFSRCLQKYKKKIEQLRNEIRRHEHLYYVLAQPEIDDRQFDMLIKELETLEEQHPEFRSSDSPAQRCGLVSL